MPRLCSHSEVDGSRPPCADTSFPMPPRGADPALEDAALAVTVESQQREARAYNTGVAFAPHQHGGGGEDGAGSDDDDEDDEEEDGGGGAANGGGGGMALVQLANGETVTLPLWLLNHLQQQQLGDDEDDDDEEEDGDYDGEAEEEEEGEEDDEEAEEEEEEEEDENNPGDVDEQREGAETPAPVVGVA